MSHMCTPTHGTHVLVTAFMREIPPRIISKVPSDVTHMTPGCRPHDTFWKYDTCPNTPPGLHKCGACWHKNGAHYQQEMCTNVNSTWAISRLERTEPPASMPTRACCWEKSCRQHHSARRTVHHAFLGICVSWCNLASFSLWQHVCWPHAFSAMQSAGIPWGDPSRWCDLAHSSSSYQTCWPHHVWCKLAPFLRWWQACWPQPQWCNLAQFPLWHAYWPHTICCNARRCARRGSPQGISDWMPLMWPWLEPSGDLRFEAGLVVEITSSPRRILSEEFDTTMATTDTTTLVTTRFEDFDTEAEIFKQVENLVIDFKILSNGFMRKSHRPEASHELQIHRRQRLRIVCPKRGRLTSCQWFLCRSGHSMSTGSVAHEIQFWFWEEVTQLKTSVRIQLPPWILANASPELVIQHIAQTRGHETNRSNLFVRQFLLSAVEATAEPPEM